MEYSKNNALEDLKRISFMINTLTDVYKKKQHMRSNSRRKVRRLYDSIEKIYTSEMDKEVKIMKENMRLNGEFMTSEEVDELVDNILKEENVL